MSTLHAAGGVSTSFHSKESGDTYTFKTVSIVSGDELRDFNVTLNGLKRNTRYGIIIQAFNRKGPGPNSEEVIAQTPEFGEYQFIQKTDVVFCNVNWVSQFKQTTKLGM